MSFVVENNFRTKGKPPPYSSYSKNHHNSLSSAESFRLFTEAWFLTLRTRVAKLPQNSPNIYDPLYSSKKDGVGLGLSTVYQTINENSFLNFFKFLAWAYDGSFYIEMRNQPSKNTPVIKYAARYFIRNL